MNNPVFWAKFSGLCRVLASHAGDKCYIDNEDAELLRVLGDASPRDCIRLAIGYNDTEWMNGTKED